MDIARFGWPQPTLIRPAGTLPMVTRNALEYCRCDGAGGKKGGLRGSQNGVAFFLVLFGRA